MEPIADIEATLAPHWSIFGTWPGGTRHEDAGLLWFENPIASLPYNGVVRTWLPAGVADRAIDRVHKTVANRGYEPITG